MTGARSKRGSTVARAGMGVAVAFSRHVSEFVKERTLTTLLDEFQPAPLPVSLVYASNRFMPIKLRAFLDFAAPRLKSRLAGHVHLHLSVEEIEDQLSATCCRR